MDTYAYLGFRNTKDGDCEKEIRSRLAKVYAIATQLKCIMAESRDSKFNKGKTAKGLSELVWPVATTVCDGWNRRKHDEQK